MRRLKVIVFINLVLIGSMLQADRLSAALAAKRPNILFVLTDDLGYGDLACYGGSDIRTPNIDRLANEGARFTDAYAAFPVCSPSRAAILTGQYVHRFGPSYERYFGGSTPEGLIPEKHPTLSSLLRDAGYRTSCIGKWNVNNPERNRVGANDHGFDHWLGFHLNINYFKHVVERTNEADFLLDNRPIQRDGWVDTIFADDAIEIIQQQGGENKNPFFIYLAFQTPHSPIQDPDDPNSIPHPKKEMLEEGRRLYVKMVERLDSDLGRVLTALENSGAAENTIVIFTSDNGGSVSARNDPLRGRKLQLFEGGIRIPQIIRWPNIISSGSVCKTPTIHMDVTRTLAIAAGVTDLGKVGSDGVDLRPLLTGDLDVVAKLSNRPLYWRHRETEQPPSPIIAAAVRVGDWKYQRFHKRNPESSKEKLVESLYNLRDDIEEENDLAETNSTKLTQLRTLLEEWELDIQSANAQ